MVTPNKTWNRYLVHLIPIVPIIQEAGGAPPPTESYVCDWGVWSNSRVEELEELNGSLPATLGPTLGQGEPCSD